MAATPNGQAAAPNTDIADGASSKKGQRRTERLLVPIILTVFVILRALDRVFLNRCMKIMGVYGGTLMALYWPICIQLMTVCICAGYVLMKRFSEGDTRYGLGWFSPVSPLASTHGRVPFYVMGVFSFFDQLNAAATAVPQRFLPEAMQTALTNTVVIWTALIAYFYLGSRFKQVHYAGCILIVLACITGTVVELQSGDLPAPTNASGEVVSVATGTMVLMYVIYVVGCIPSGMSNCYKQKVMKRFDMDLMWATLWSGNFQVVWGLLLYTINWIPYPTPGGYNTQSPATLAQDLGHSWTCFIGENPHPGISSCSADQAWVWFLVYLVFNVSFNVLMLWLTKYLSATWASIGNVLCGDLYGIFGQFGFVSGGGRNQWMPLEEWLALAFSSVAMWVYNIEDEVDIDGNSVYGVASDNTKESKTAVSESSDESIQAIQAIQV